MIMSRYGQKHRYDAGEYPEHASGEVDESVPPFTDADLFLMVPKSDNTAEEYLFNKVYSTRRILKEIDFQSRDVIKYLAKIYYLYDYKHEVHNWKWTITRKISSVPRCLFTRKFPGYWQLMLFMWFTPEDEADDIHDIVFSEMQRVGIKPSRQRAPDVFGFHGFCAAYFTWLAEELSENGSVEGYWGVSAKIDELLEKSLV